MLSRVAESILWMSRYVERAENTARIIDVNSRQLLDSGAGDHTAAWEPLVSLVPETRALFDSLYPELTPSSVSRFLTFEPANPNSILNTIVAARENARGIRESISSEMWEQMNTLYLWITEGDAQAGWLASPHSFFRRVQYGSQQFQGTTDATMLRDEGWLFMQVGKYLERADSATRILDTKYGLFAGEPSGDPFDAMPWIALLKSCSAYEAFRRRQLGAELSPRDVAHFLLLEPDFPRSVLFCINESWAALRAIGGARGEQPATRVERVLGLLHAQLTYADIDDVLGMLHTYLDQIQRHLNRVGDELQRAYLHAVPRPVFSAASGRVAQAMAEQQQQVRRPC